MTEEQIKQNRETLGNCNMADWRDKNIPKKCRGCEHCEKYMDLYTPYYMGYWKYSCKKKNCCKAS